MIICACNFVVPKPLFLLEFEKKERIHYIIVSKSGRMKYAQCAQIQRLWPSTVIVLYIFASKVHQNSIKNVTKFSFMVKNVHLITLFKRELEGMADFLGKKKQSLKFLIKC